MTITKTPKRDAGPVMPRAAVFCEGQFAKIDGKTANGLVRHSERYAVIGVVDSTRAGLDSGTVLDGKKNDIPIFASLAQLIAHTGSTPETFIYGVAPSDGKLPSAHRAVVLEAIRSGMNIVCGLHMYLGEDTEMVHASKASGVFIHDVRKPPPIHELRVFDGSVTNVRAVRIAVLGTDCAIGKRTTATILTDALNAHGIRTVLVGTGQTGLMQGARYGVAMDAIPPQFLCGQLEGEVVKADDEQQPDVIVVEGQGALSHPAFCTSASILRGSQPQGVIIQHAPERVWRVDFPKMPVASPAQEIALIQSFADTKVIGLTLNHEGMGDDAAIQSAINQLTTALGLPVTDALRRPTQALVDMVCDAFPVLKACREPLTV